MMDPDSSASVPAVPLPPDEIDPNRHPVAITNLVYRNYHAPSGRILTVGNAHTIDDDKKVDFAPFMMDLIMKAGIQDGDEYRIAIQKVGPRFNNTMWVADKNKVGHFHRLEIPSIAPLHKNPIIPD